MPNVAYFPIAYYAILRARGRRRPDEPAAQGRRDRLHLVGLRRPVAVVCTAVRRAEATKAARETGTDVLVVAPGEFDDLLAGRPTPTEGVAERGAADTAVILYTSGTTGRPKGAELTHANLRSNVADLRWRRCSQRPGTTSLFGGLPLFHSFGQTCGLNASIAGGACLTLLPKFDGEQALSIVASGPGQRLPGRTDHVHGPARGARSGPLRHQSADPRRLGGRLAAGGGAARGRAGLRVPAARGLRAVRDLPGRLVQPPGPPSKPGSVGVADPWGGVRRSGTSDDGAEVGGAPTRSARSSSAART